MKWEYFIYNKNVLLRINVHEAVTNHWSIVWLSLITTYQKFNKLKPDVQDKAWNKVNLMKNNNILIKIIFNNIFHLVISAMAALTTRKPMH